MGLKLGQRLSQIESMVDGDYDHIWDCCCDHGLLGMTLLERKGQSHIHFVDIVPEIIKKVQGDLEKSYGELSVKWSVHCTDIVKIPLSSYSGRHLIIVAGVGGDLTQEFMISLDKGCPDMQIDYLLCPVYHQFDLRKCLVELDFVLKKECLVCENKRYYEVLLVSKKYSSHLLGKVISPVGEDIWKYPNEEQKSIAKGYLEKKLSHYKRRQGSGVSLGAYEKYKSIIIEPDICE